MVAPVNARIEHVALWTREPERLRDFYVRWFGAESNDGYENPKKQFRSYFLRFGSGARIELMQTPSLRDTGAQPVVGYAHVALTLGSEAAVDELTTLLRDGGITVLDGPRRTGDGYYESVVLDPDGNRIELTA
ncbi:MAG: VOC family protein [Casimicrobiaceae bacterium]